jgi:hypothetical protein
MKNTHEPVTGRQRARQWIVGTLVVILAVVEPVGLLAQRSGGVITPPTMKPPHLRLPEVLDPIFAAITTDMIASAQDAHQHGMTATHMRRHAGHLRALATHFTETGIDAQIMDWANAQNPDVFQFQMPDPNVVDTALALRRQQGLPTDDIAQALNATPQFKRTVLMNLRAKAFSAHLIEEAALIERTVTHNGLYGADPRVSPVLLSMDKPADGGGGGGLTFTGCQIIGAEGLALGAIALFIPVVGWFSFALSLYNFIGCPGCPCPGTTSQRLPRREVAIWKL